jgi:Immunoglobulin I-set domain
VPNQLVGAPLVTDVKLICNVEASPKAINYWQRENGKLTFFSPFHLAFLLFIVTATTLVDCDANTYFFKIIALSVVKKFIAVLYLFCPFSHFFLFFVKRIGEMIISNDRYHMTETENSMYAVQMDLVIRKLQKSDMGGYKCISKNSIGDAEGTIRLYGKYF